MAMVAPDLPMMMPASLVETRDLRESWCSAPWASGEGSCSWTALGERLSAGEESAMVGEEEQKRGTEDRDIGWRGISSTRWGEGRRDEELSNSYEEPRK